MSASHFAVCAFSIGTMLIGANDVFSQNYPSKPIRVITAAAGGGLDFAARQISLGLAASLGQQVVVENRGGSGVIAAELVARAPADGYTLLSFGSAIWIGPLMSDKPSSYDPVGDFAPISLTNRSPNVLVVHPSLPVSTVKDLIVLAKAKPGALNYASAGAGGSSHLAAELFKNMAEVNIVRVPYRANAAALIDLLSGQVQVMFSTTTAAAPHMQSGKLRALAVTSAEPSALLPGLPTAAASGLPGYEAASITGMFAPAKTPVALINRLHQEIVRVLNQVDVKERFFNVGVEVVGSSPEQLAATVKSEMVRLGKVIKVAGIKAD